MKRILIAAILALAGAVGVAHAGLQNDIPSCYAANKMGRSAPEQERELFVLIDQTTPLDEKLRESVRENVGHFLKPGTAFVVAHFSAFSQGRYMEVISAGALEAPLPEKDRGSVGVKVLRSFDACLQGQAAYGLNLAASAINKAMEGSSASLARSDVLSSIKELSTRVKQSAAREKVVFLVSDMLENSSISSFYAAKNIRAIDPAKELKAVEAARMFGDFGGARVFVLGGGIVQEKGADAPSGVYRDPRSLQALKDFWRGLFTSSNAELVEFGMPALMVPVH